MKNNSTIRGMVATTMIAKGTVIEIAPVASFPPQQRNIIDQTKLDVYSFVIGSEYEHSKNVHGHIVFGGSSLCSHSEMPNAYIKRVENEIGLWMHLIALKDIQQGDEATLFYSNIDEYSEAFQFV